jgi:hypothetical protein
LKKILKRFWLYRRSNIDFKAKAVGFSAFFAAFQAFASQEKTFFLKKGDSLILVKISNANISIAQNWNKNRCHCSKNIAYLVTPIG